MTLEELIAHLRRTGEEDARTEVKTAAGGFPDSVAPTISAFANTPGGGQVIFGVDEAKGFAVTGVYDAKLCQQAVSSMARNALTPAHTVTTEVGEVDGLPVVLVTVPEANRALKPVRVRKTGLAYLRQFDGDYPISEQEEQAFIADRGQPVFDEDPVRRATIDDLDATALKKYLTERRLMSPILSRMSDDDVLRHTGIITDGHPSVAGLLALGAYPQQFFANLGIQASFVPASGSGTDLRAVDQISFTGPIPTMLEETISWVYTTTGRAIVADPISGSVADKPAYPLIAVRELVANALIHRDLGPHALNQPITLRISPDKVTLTNPGGLFGLRVDTLGLTPSHLRNGRLAEVCQFVTTRDGSRVVERLGTGIPAVREALHTAGMRPPGFLDQGVRFVATMYGGHSLAGTSSQVTVRRMLARHGALTTRQLIGLTGLTTRQITHALRQLIDENVVVASPLDGRSNLYSLMNSGTHGDGSFVR